MSKKKTNDKDHEIKEEKSCCDDGTCSLCIKNKEIKTEEDLGNDKYFEKEKIIDEDESENEEQTDENESEEVEDVDEKIVTEKKKDKKDFGKFKREKIKKNPVNKILTVVLAMVIIASVVAGIMAFSFFNRFKSDKISKDIFDNEQVIEFEGETWTLQTEPKVIVEVFSSEDCENCVDEDVISFLKIQIPTLEVKKIDVKKDESNVDLKYIPAFVFDDNITKTDFYNRAEELFTEENGEYVLQTAQLGFPIGEQLGEMTDEKGFMVGSEDAKVSVIAVTDFGCEECAIANPILDKLEVEYKNKAKFTYKIFTDVEDEKLMNVSMAVFCADEQDKFDAYSDTIFARQSAWQTFEGDLTNVLTNYAVNLRLDKAKFGECLSNKKYESQIKEMNKEIMDYGFTSVPVYFVDGERIDGVPTYEGMGAMLKKAVN
ncbi:MAG: thioredoxin domain-containing protein [Candidatus Moranbacteria bacterium]|nr:thioredoxin domain-containing protein [Candidatus Moranbacteria bacterium]